MKQLHKIRHWISAPTGTTTHAMICYGIILLSWLVWMLWVRGKS